MLSSLRRHHGAHQDPEALTLLDAKKTKEALAALELASELELVLARDAKLALAPVDVRVITTISTPTWNR